MRKLTHQYYSQIVSLGIIDDEDRELLGNSLYYYCCGSDATPIIAFGSQYPLYVYVDIVQYGYGDFAAVTNKLYQRLIEFGFQRTDIIHKGDCYYDNDNDLRKSVRKPVIKQSEWSEWISRDNKSFQILYIQGDAIEVFRKLYHTVDRGGKDNYILPKCICNFRYELMPCDTVLSSLYQGDIGNILNQAEKRVQYIMGHTHNHYYKMVGEYNYYGDYGAKSIPFYKKICYYVY